MGGFSTLLGGRRRGLMSTLMGVGEDPGAQPEQPASPSDNRFVDDPVTRNQPAPPSDDLVSQAPQMAQASRASLAQKMQQPAQPEEDPYAPLKQQIGQMRGEYDKLNQPAQPVSLKQKILGVLGGPALSGTSQNQRNFDQSQRTAQSGRLLQEIQAGQRTLGSEQTADKRIQQQDEAEEGRNQRLMDTIRGQSDRAQPEHMDTDEGPIQFNQRTRQWEPIMVGGVRAGSKQAAGKAPNRDDQAIAIYSKPKTAWTPEEASYIRGYEQYIRKSKTDPGVARAQIFVEGKPVQMEDPATGAKYYERAGQAMGEGKSGIAGGTNLQKNAYQPQARIKDVERVSTAIEGSTDALDQDNSQRLLIANALSDPSIGTAAAFTRSKFAQNMSPQSRDYVANVLSMREQIMGLNQLLTGTSGTSDARIKAIWDTLPNGAEPDSDMARRKMQLVRGMIGNVREAFPAMQLIPGQGGQQGLKGQVSQSRGDLGPAPPGSREGRTGKMPDGTPVVVRGGRLVPQQ